MADGPAIRTENLSMRYRGGVLALDDLNIDIEHGSSVGYLGPNGAGKSTTIKILTTLIRPTRGKAYLNGIDVAKRPKEAMRTVGSLVEVPGLYDYLTPHEMMEYVGRVRGMKKADVHARITEALVEVKLQDWEHKKLRSFSTGMGRRFSIALALLHDPDILILDEPVLGLDPVGMKEIRDIIKKLTDTNRTVFLSSHLLSEVQETCDRVIMLNRGKVIVNDRVDNLRVHMGDQFLNVQFTSNLDGAQRQTLASLSGAEVVDVINNYAKLKFDGSPETSARLLRELHKFGLQVTAFWPTQASLEDIYVQKFRDDDGRIGGEM